MSTTTITFRAIPAKVSYTCTCGECGKSLKREAKVEHTVNPFNKNDDGSVKTPREVYDSALAEAQVKAAALQGEPDICRDCADAPYRAKLLEMAAEPDRIFAYKDMTREEKLICEILKDRGHVDWASDRCECGAACCSGSSGLGYRITGKGKERAAKLQAAQQKEAA